MTLVPLIMCFVSVSFPGTVMTDQDDDITDIWPDGPYATPMSVYGCPGSDANGWKTGYVNMTFRQRISEGLDAVSDARKASLLGPYSENVVQLNFCYKLRSSNSTFDTPVHDRPADGTNSTLDTQVHDRSTDGSNSTLDTLVNDKPAGDSSNSTLDTPVQERPADGSNSTLDTPVHDMPVDDSNSTLYNPVHGWPAGDYGIYRAEGICPQGFLGRNFTFTFPPLLHLNVDGHLPDLTFKEDSSTFQIIIYTCYKEASGENDSRVSSWKSPFILLPGFNNTMNSSDARCPDLQNTKFKKALEQLDLIQTRGSLNGTGATNETSLLHGAFEYCMYVHDISVFLDQVTMEDIMYGAADYFFFNLVLVPQDAKQEYPAFDETWFLFRNNDLQLHPQPVWIKEPGPDQEKSWILIDLEQTVDIRHIIIFHGRMEWDLTDMIMEGRIDWFGNYDEIAYERFARNGEDDGYMKPWYDPSLLVKLTEDMPRISAGVDKWAVLANGGLKCNSVPIQVQRWPFIIQQCERPISARYLAFVDTGYVNDPIFNRIRKVYVSGKGVGCGKELGMNDGGINDFQVSASTETEDHPAAHSRPGLSGWCADPADSSPYLQIELLVNTTVDGIRIYNWYEYYPYYNESVYTKVNIPMGIQSFTLDYGYQSDGGLTSYSIGNGEPKVFTLDKSQPYDSVQTFNLLNPVVSSIIRIRPVGVAGSTVAPCLKIELLGCRLYKTKSIQCANRTNAMMKPMKNIFVPPESHHSSVNKLNITTRECVAQCTTEPTCAAVKIFDDGCTMYNSSATSNYHVLTNDAEFDSHSKNTTFYQKLCTNEPMTFGQLAMQQFNSLIKPEGMVTVVDEPEIITNVGYPMSYATGVKLQWVIELEGGSEVVFTNISLNEYENEYDTEFTGRKCKDRLVIHEPYRARNHYDYFDNILLDIIDNSLNGKQIVYTTNYRSLYIWFYTCVRKDQLLKQGGGFRAVVRKPEMATCKSSMSSCSNSITESNLVAIVPNTFTGAMLPLQREEIWHITLDGRYLSLTFTDVDIICNQGSSLEVTVDGENLSFCNLHRPIDAIIPRNNQLTIRFYNGQLPGTLRHEGFKATYSVLKHKGYIEHMLFEIKENTTAMDSRLILFEVCSDVFHKCYRYFHGTVKAHDYCSSLDNPAQQPVRIQSEVEDDFVIYHLTHGVNASLPYSQLVIGLRRDINSRGDLVEKWADGNSLSYAAWKPGEPADVRRNKCTKINIGYYSEENSWETFDCNDELPVYYVCEYFTMTNSQENLHSQLLGNHVQIDSMSEYRLFQCNSGEYVSQFDVCDGLKTCLDASDERNCPDEKWAALESTCPVDYFKCSSGECVPISACCDFVPDCRDSSDEFCEFPVCTEGEFKCTNGQCIPAATVCDLERNCWDGSDELNCVTCNGATFQCSDLHCIPLSRVCDSFSDCASGEDEAECTPVSMSSCTEWWQNGYRRTGQYVVGENIVECNFDHVITRGIVQTIYHDLDFDYRIKFGDTFEAFYGDRDFVASMLSHNEQCTISFLQTCHPPGDFVANIAGNAGYSCPCVRSYYVYPHGYTYRIECSEELIDPALAIWDSEFPTNSFRLSTELPRIHDYRHKLEPIVCERNISLADETFSCGQGGIVSTDELCIYQVGVDGIVTGCRDFSHLQHCADFVCPAGYVKCPNSYCLPANYLCDGTRQCPDGNDEINCWCGHMKSRLAIVYAADEGAYTDDKRLDLVAETMALQLIQPQPNSNVDLYRYHIFEKQITVKVNLTAEITTFSHSKINQWSQDVTLAMKTITDFLPFVTTSLTNGSYDAETTFGIVLLVKHRSQTSSVLRSIFKFDHTFLKGVNLYVVDVGGSSESLSMDYQDTFPTAAKYADLWDVHNVATYSMDIFRDICPGELTPSCPGMFRCHASRLCLNTTFLCDGIRQCPHGDDEKLCDFRCPDNCTCNNGYSVDCSSFRATTKSLRKLDYKTRYLDLHGNDLSGNLTVDEVMRYVVLLNMSKCELSIIPIEFITSMLNLLNLDLSHNKLQGLRKGDFANKEKLLNLDLTGNYELKFIEADSISSLISLKTLSIKYSRLNQLQANTFKSLTLSEIVLSHNQIVSVHSQTFHGLTTDKIDIRGNFINQFNTDMFDGVEGLKVLMTDAFKFCCIKPESVSDDNCLPQRDEFSSCDDLMREEALKFLLWVIGFCALIGNFLSLLYRLRFDRKRLKLGYGIFVTNLAIADFLMGIYLLIIAVADVSFRGRYITWDDWWRSSAWCSFAGVISTISSEGSVLFICLITLDRILVIKYPFGDIRFNTKTAIISSVVAWLLVIIVATVPLGFGDGAFYTRSAVCLALPLTRDRPSGWEYSTAIFIGFNFVAFLLIAAGQCLIFREIRATSNIRKASSNRRNDLVVARNLLLVVSTDFLCWFPIGVMGLSALNGHVVSGDVYAWAAVLILPINSALNPFLYTFSAIIGQKKFKPRTEEQSESSIISKDSIREIIKVWDRTLNPTKSSGQIWTPLSTHLSKNTITADDVERIVQNITKTVADFHAVGLITGDFDTGDVHVVAEGGNILEVSLVVTPRLPTREAEKKRDIQTIENITQTLLRARMLGQSHD